MADESRARFKIGEENFELDFDELTLDEVGVIEDLTGKTVSEIEWESARAIKGVAWIAMSRRNPRFTLEEAGRLKLSEFKFGDDEPAKGQPKRPTRAAAAGKSGGD